MDQAYRIVGENCGIVSNSLIPYLLLSVSLEICRPARVFEHRFVHREATIFSGLRDFIPFFRSMLFQQYMSMISRISGLEVRQGL